MSSASTAGTARAAGAAGAAGALLMAGLVLAGCSSSGGNAASYPSAQVSVFHVRVGQCLNPPTKVQAQVATLSVVSCKAPHTEQVYALVTDHAGAAYPGPSKLESFANAQCLQRFQGFVGVPYQRSSLFFTYLLPSVRSWEQGDRTVSCIITTTGQKLTSSVQGSKR